MKYIKIRYFIRLLEFKISLMSIFKSLDGFSGELFYTGFKARPAASRLPEVSFFTFFNLQSTVFFKVYILMIFQQVNWNMAQGNINRGNYRLQEYRFFVHTVFSHYIGDFINCRRVERSNDSNIESGTSVSCSHWFPSNIYYWRCK